MKQNEYDILIANASAATRALNRGLDKCAAAVHTKGMNYEHRDKKIPSENRQQGRKKRQGHAFTQTDCKAGRPSKVETFSKKISEWPTPIDQIDVVVDAVHVGEPLSKARPRFCRNGGVYTPQRTRFYEAELRDTLSKSNTTKDSESRFGLRCFFFRPNRKRIDVDNMLKAVSDAANGLVWKDDSQVTEVFGKLIIVSENPRTEILIYKTEGSTAWMDGDAMRLKPTKGQRWRVSV